jgi:hypothetical protein
LNPSSAYPFSKNISNNYALPSQIFEFPKFRLIYDFIGFLNFDSSALNLAGFFSCKIVKILYEFEALMIKIINYPASTFIFSKILFMIYPVKIIDKILFLTANNVFPRIPRGFWSQVSGFRFWVLSFQPSNE